MRAIYLWLSRVIALGVVLQAAFIAFGMFEISNMVGDGKAFTEDSDRTAGVALHSVVGMMIIPLLVLLMLIASFFARVPGGVQLALVALGVVVLQVVLGFVSYGAPVIGLLHGVNAFVLAGVAGFAGRRASQATNGAPGAGTTAAA